MSTLWQGQTTLDRDAALTRLRGIIGAVVASPAQEFWGKRGGFVRLRADASLALQLASDQLQLSCIAAELEDPEIQPLFEALVRGLLSSMSLQPEDAARLREFLPPEPEPEPAPRPPARVVPRVQTTVVEIPATIDVFETSDILMPGQTQLIGMVHLLALPGSPGWAGSMRDVLEAARADAQALLEGGCDAILVENMGDVPYLRGHVHPETTAAMACATAEVVSLGVPTGVQILAGANREALGVAVATGASFIRAEGFAYAHVADEGWMDACAGPLLRARSSLGSSVEIWTDIKKKHAAHAVTADLSVREVGEGALFCGANALIATGASTGHKTGRGDVIALVETGAPVLVGSGVTPENMGEYVGLAHGVIVGSWLKYEGSWRNRVSADRVSALRRALDGAYGA